MVHSFLPLLLHSPAIDSFTLKMEAIYSTETLTNKCFLLRVQVVLVIVISRVIDSRSFEGTYSLLINITTHEDLNDNVPGR
jgi:hypothetical protein